MREEQANSSRLPKFLIEFLRKNDISYIPISSSNVSVDINETNVGKCIEMLSRQKTNRKINETYNFVKNSMINGLTDYLQHEYIQMFFPIFLGLAFEACMTGDEKFFIAFLNENSGDHLSFHQEEIDKLKKERFDYRLPSFTVKLSSLAFNRLLFVIDSDKHGLISDIINKCIRIDVTEETHPIMYSNSKETMSINSGSLLSPIDTDPNSIFISYTGVSADSVQESEYHSLHQSFPDIGHIEILNHEDNINHLAISMNSRLLSICQGNKCDIFSLDGVSTFNDELNQTLVYHDWPVLSSAFSSDSIMIATAAKSIKLSNLEAFVPVCHYTYGYDPYYSVCWDKSSHYIAAGGKGTFIPIWDISQPNFVRYFSDHSLPISKVLFSNDSKTLLSSSFDLTVRLWDIGTAKCISKVSTDNSPPIVMDINQSNTKIACGTKDGTILVWNSQTGERLWKHQLANQFITDMKFTRDGSLMIVSTIEGRVYMFRADSGVDPMVSINTTASTIDTICITERNGVVTAGRSNRGDED